MGREGPQGKQKYSSTLSLTSALDGVGGRLHATATLPPGETRYPLHRRLDGVQSQYGLAQKVSSPPGLDFRTVQLVASRYSNWAIPAHGPANNILKHLFYSEETRNEVTS